MTPSPSTADKYGWLPEPVESVAFRLARADECAFQIGDLASQWSSDGPLDFEQVRQGEYVQLFVTRLRPAPPEASLLFSEAVNHLRATIDNVIWYLVEREHGELTGYPATLVNMPIVQSPRAFDNWIRKRVQNKISAFGEGTPLHQRIRALQHYADSQSSIPSMGELLARLTGQAVERAHPLLLLQAYSNYDKHRSIRIAAARTFGSSNATPLAAQKLGHQALRVGDAFGPKIPWGHPASQDANTALMVERPDPFTAWVNPTKELNAMRRHVSDVVLPILLTGLEMPNGLPPRISLGDDGRSNRERLNSGTWEDAEARIGPVVRARYEEAMAKEPEFAPIAEDAPDTLPTE
ncbi:hypothetical protein [Arthrobacter sp. B0490]|uniref:hypothetical protein n=1 Tax=Arthrobacter sp. B0490 TaxID=2058891 RepID=UPI000CE3C403|nr:hypothetical protein [Arthrobacter sp. B0490]